MFLIVEYPSCGRLGYKFLVSENCVASDREIIDLVGRGNMASSLSIIKTIEDIHTRRNARVTIVVAGVDATHMPHDKTDAAYDMMEQCFAEVEAVALTTDWASTGGSLIVKMPVLSKHLAALQALDLPLVKPPHGSLLSRIKSTFQRLGNFATS